MATFEPRKTKAGEKRIRAVIRRSGFKTLRCTFATMKAARDWASVKESAILDGRHGLSEASGQHTVAEMIDRYLDKVLPHKSKKKRYIRQQRQQLLWWRARLGKYALCNVTKPLLIDCRDELQANHGPATVNRYLAALGHVFTIARKQWEWITVSPLDGIDKLKEPKGRARYLRDEERPSFLEACQMEKKKPLFLIAVLVIAMGARKEEITTLLRRNVDLERGMATQEDTKNGETKTFFITGFALQLLRDYMARTAHRKTPYVFPNRSGKMPITIDREFRRARRRAGIDDFVFHDLRHTHASYLAMESNADPKTIAESLNQKTLNMANRYTHLTKRFIADKVQQMTDKIFGSLHNTGGNDAAGQ